MSIKNKNKTIKGQKKNSVEGALALVKVSISHSYSYLFIASTLNSAWSSEMVAEGREPYMIPLTMQE